ncbi:MAG TPA: hypothetical protein VEZ11_03810 [Thermoanaerobaculia bacterium]|nr:hypothetical protein [Thermoanaerobaculia bacterium]
MSVKRLVIILIVVGVAYYLYTQRASFTRTTSTSSASGATSEGAANCVASAEMAYNKVSSAASLVTRPPGDASAWQAAESSATAAISSAESACGSASSDKERQVADEVHSALTAMKTLMNDLAAAAKGTGGATEGARTMEEIDNHLEKARSLSK